MRSLQSEGIQVELIIAVEHSRKSLTITSQLTFLVPSVETSYQKSLTSQIMRQIDRRIGHQIFCIADKGTGQVCISVYFSTSTVNVHESCLQNYNIMTLSFIHLIMQNKVECDGYLHCSSNSVIAVTSVCAIVVLLTPALLVGFIRHVRLGKASGAKAFLKFDLSPLSIFFFEKFHR